MRLNNEDADTLAYRIVHGTATQAEIDTAVAIMKGRVPMLLTLADAHIVATYTTEKTRRFDFNAAQSHRETILAMKSPGGSLYDLDFEGEPVTFKSWRELVTLENDPQWGNQYIGPFAERGAP